MFPWYDHLASTFVPSLGLGDVTWHLETLNKYTLKALHDSQNSIALLATKVTQMREAVLQNRTVAGVLTAAPGGTWATNKVDCVYIFQITTKM